MNASALPCETKHGNLSFSRKRFMLICQ